MPGTILQSFPRFSDGLLLFESFEAENFMSDQNWTLLNGTPQISSDVSVDGLKSLKLDTTYPQIQKITGAFQFGVAWFYDDSSIVAGGFTPFAIWETTGGQIFGLGVDLGVSTVNYTKIVNGVSSDSGVARTTDYRRFTIKQSLGSVDLAIDGVSVGGAAIATALTKTKIGCSVYSGTSAFGYFDSIQVCQFADFTVTHLDSGQMVKVYLSDGTLVGQATAASGLAQVDTTAQDSPFNGYVTITRPDGQSPYFWGAVLSFSTGDRWAQHVYRFGRRPVSLDIRPTANRQDKESNSGKNQSVFFYDRDIVSFTITDLTEDEKNALMRWWSTAQRGEVFGCAIDEGGTYRSTLAEAIVSAAQTLFKPASLVGANKGSLLVIRTATGQFRDTKKVVGRSGPYLEADSFFISPFEIGDEIRDLLYWPAAITTDKVLQVSLANLRRRRWNATISFKEAL
jgi:hypothetical protein